MILVRTAPVYRYRVILALERAKNTPGILEEDRNVILEKARDLAASGVRKYPGNKNILSTYCDVGLEIYRRTKNADAFEDGMSEMKAAEESVGDPEISKQIKYFERRRQLIDYNI